MEESDDVSNLPSETEDLLVSDAEDASLPENDIPLSIDYNARLVTAEEKLNNEGDDCDMHFVAKSFLGQGGPEGDIHTSSEDLNISDEDSSYPDVALKLVNLDGIASALSQKCSNLSTLNYSHSVFKDGNSTDAEYLSDEEVGFGMNKTFAAAHKHNEFPPKLSVPGLSSGLKLGSLASQTTQKPLNAFNIKNVFTNSILIDEGDMNDPSDDQESPPMTCLEFLKSELSDGGHNTDAEDVSVGSLDDLDSSRSRNPFEKDNNAPVSLLELSLGNVDKRHSYPENSRRLSNAHTEDETFSLENFCDRRKKRVKKRNFRLAEKNEKSDSLTDEELIEDQ